MAGVSYVMPIRRSDTDADELIRMRRYLQRLAACGCEVIVVDGSPPTAYSRHATAWGDVCRHLPVDPRWRFLNGKVNGVLSGVAHATCEAVVLADDDVVYGLPDVKRMGSLLRQHDLVVPQNFFQPLRWWARIETGRILLNRALRPAGDYPGTFGVRRSVFQRIGPYNGDVLFENEEMRRHFLRHGARVYHARDFFIARRPPTFAKWREQRVRQAYEDLGARAKTTAFLMLLPVGVAIAAANAPSAAIYAGAVFVTAVALAAVGRQDGAEAVVPLSVCLTAPL